MDGMESTMTPKNKVLIVGIDGLDADLLLRFKNQLPNFARLMQKCPLIKMSSVFPPDSPTAWASIFTGLNPAKHGIVSFKDPLSRSKVGEYLDNVYNLVGRTFWDYAGKYKKKCCIIFPHLAYPPWPVNGILISRTTEVDIRKFDIKTYPPDFPLGCNPMELKPITSFPANPSQIIQPTKQLILNEVKFGTHFFKDFDWDVFFIFFSSLDNIEHIFWMYFDETDPEQPKPNPYKEVIPNFYKFYDEHVIGRFLRIVESDTAFVVLSDHGHGMRPYNVVNVHEFLAKAGLLKTKIKYTNILDVNYLRQFIKMKLTRLINEKRVIAKFVSKFLSLFPHSLELYISSSPLDWNETITYLSDSSGGLKAYSYAGVRVRKDNVSPFLYEQIRQSIIELLMQIKDPTSSERIVEWAIRREELYNGPFISKYPDVVFKLKNGWGVGWETTAQLYSRSLSHKLHSGNHRQESATFLLDHPNGLRPRVNNITLTDVAPTVLDLLGINDPNLHRLFDGKSVLVPINPHFLP
jgi:predicted AlkP superfamily phosphohydrolase/phosphomutase